MNDSTGAPPRFRCGLVVGKFSPLHRGHQFLIERALSACDEVLIISYSVPEFPRCEATARQRWLASLYPQARRLVIDPAGLATLCARQGRTSREIPHNDASDEAHRLFCAWLCHDVLDARPDAVFTSEDYGDGFAAVLSRYFTTATGRPHTVRHVCVDRARVAVPVSGTALRATPAERQRYLSPIVNADCVDRICLLGGESTGKSVLAEALAAEFGTTWVPEYGRERWLEKDGQLDFADMLEIGRMQVVDEDERAGAARRWLFCDTSPLTTAFYSEAMLGRVDDALWRLADRPYQRIWICAPDFPFVQDGTRRDPEFRSRQHDWYLAELGRRRLPFDILTGSHQHRLAQAQGWLRDVPDG